jgi:hypothetical protein
MPKGPKDRSAPADVIGSAAKVMRIATGEEEEAASDKSAAAELGSLGGNARAANLSKKQQSEIARKAAAKRWKPSARKVQTRADRRNGSRFFIALVPCRRILGHFEHSAEMHP